MLESIKRFLIGDPPGKDDNRIYYGEKEPKARGGILFWPQLVKGDIWIDTANKNDTYYYSGKVWDKVTS